MTGKMEIGLPANSGHDLLLGSHSPFIESTASKECGDCCSFSGSEDKGTISLVSFRINDSIQVRRNLLRSPCSGISEHFDRWGIADLVAVAHPFCTVTS